GSNTNFIEFLFGLAAGSYQFRAVASNGFGLFFGSNLSFSTPGPPTVATLSATSVDPNSANLNGVANPNGFSTTVWFEYGTTTNYGAITGSQSIGSGSSNINFSQSTAAYSAGTTLQFRAVASNSAAVVYGTNQSYTLPITAIATLPATFGGPNAATLNGVA